MTTDSPASLHHTVRALTRATHEDLERRLDLETGEWTRPKYAAFLRATLAVVAPLETPIAALLDGRFAFLDGRPGPAARLRHDLAALAEDADRGGVQGTTPRVATVADAFGAAYVLEGSRLGGRIIAETLESRLGLTPDQLTYLRPAGPGVGPRWRAFLESLDCFGRDAAPPDRDAVGIAAERTFAAFAEAFAREALA